jgi:hypothetical protein
MDDATRAAKWDTLCRQIRDVVRGAVQGRSVTAKELVLQVAQCYTDQIPPTTDREYAERFNQGIFVSSLIQTVVNVDGTGGVKPATAQRFLDEAKKICGSCFPQ